MDFPPVEVKQQLKHETCRQRVRRAFQRGFVEKGIGKGCWMLLVPPPCSYNRSRNTNRAGNKYDGRSSVVFIEESSER